MEATKVWKPTYLFGAPKDDYVPFKEGEKGVTVVRIFEDDKTSKAWLINTIDKTLMNGSEITFPIRARIATDIKLPIEPLIEFSKKYVPFSSLEDRAVYYIIQNF